MSWLNAVGASRFRVKRTGGQTANKEKPTERMGFAMLLREYLRRKSDENWEAALLCRNNKMLHAATSRFYYALYQASRYWADKGGIVDILARFPDVHATMANVVGKNAGNNARDFREVMNELAELRIRSDYRPEFLNDSDVNETVERASTVRASFLQ